MSVITDLEALIAELPDATKKSDREDLVKKLTDAVAAMIEEAEARETASVAAATEEAEAKAAKDTAKAIKSAVSEAVAADKAAAKGPKFASIGSLPGNLFVLGLAESFDTFWQRDSEARGVYVVDFYGDKAEYFAKRERQWPHEQLPDGAWRLKVENKFTAGAVAEAAKPIIRAEGLNTRVIMHSTTSSRHQADDAVRTKGAAIANVGFAGLAVKSANGQIQAALSEDGRQLLITL